MLLEPTKDTIPKGPKGSQRFTVQRSATPRNNGTMEDRNAPITADLCDINGAA